MLLLLLLPAFPKHTFYKKNLLKFCKFHDETKMLNVRTNLRTQSSFATNNKNVFSKTMCYAALERFSSYLLQCRKTTGAAPCSRGGCRKQFTRQEKVGGETEAAGHLSQK